LLHVLREKRLLLILDNCEHLLDGPSSSPSSGSGGASGQGVELVLEILQAAPLVQLLATSRERLNVRGEHVYVVEGMEYAAEDASTSSAVRLFAQTAQRVLPDFTLKAEHLVHVLRICDLVQGMPLGLELAAAWVEMLPVETIAAE